jgi:hypothetical protein
MKKTYMNKRKNRSSKEIFFIFSLRQLVISAALVFSFSNMHAQCLARPIPCTEGFSSTSMGACTPTTGGWVGNTVASQAGWDLPNTNYAGGTQPEIEAYGNQSNGGVSETLTLVSPPVKTLGLTTATLSFMHALNLTNSGASGSGVITIKVEFSPDNLSWTQLYTQTYNATSSLTTVVQETRTLPISGLSSDSIFVRFSISGVLFKVWGWEIDNVSFSSATTSVPLFHPENNMLVYPNPAKENLTVNVKGLNATKVILTDIIGNVVYQTQMTHEKLIVDVTAFPKGMYLLQMHTETGILTQKIHIE